MPYETRELVKLKTVTLGGPINRFALDGVERGRDPVVTVCVVPFLARRSKR